MKRKYITPQAKGYAVVTSKLVATSVAVNTNHDYEISDGDEILIKQNPFDEDFFAEPR